MERCTANGGKPRSVCGSAHLPCFATTSLLQPDSLELLDPSSPILRVEAKPAARVIGLPRASLRDVLVVVRFFVWLRHVPHARYT